MSHDYIPSACPELLREWAIDLKEKISPDRIRLWKQTLAEIKFEETARWAAHIFSCRPDYLEAARLILKGENLAELQTLRWLLNSRLGSISAVHKLLEWNCTVPTPSPCTWAEVESEERYCEDSGQFRKHEPISWAEEICYDGPNFTLGYLADSRELPYPTSTGLQVTLNWYLYWLQMITYYNLDTAKQWTICGGEDTENPPIHVSHLTDYLEQVYRLDSTTFPGIPANHPYRQEKGYEIVEANLVPWEEVLKKSIDAVDLERSDLLGTDGQAQDTSP